MDLLPLPLGEGWGEGFEAAIDRISFELHELSGRAKDHASAAAFLSLVLCGAVWRIAIRQRFIT